MSRFILFIFTLPTFFISSLTANVTPAVEDEPAPGIRWPAPPARSATALIERELAHVQRGLSPQEKLYFGLGTPEELGLEGPGWATLDKDSVGLEQRLDVLRIYWRVRYTKPEACSTLDRRIRALAPSASVLTGSQSRILFCSQEELEDIEASIPSVADEELAAVRVPVCVSRHERARPKRRVRSGGPDRLTS